jgi:hypothetical protein
MADDTTPDVRKAARRLHTLLVENILVSYLGPAVLAVLGLAFTWVVETPWARTVGITLIVVALLNVVSLLALWVIGGAARPKPLPGWGVLSDQDAVAELWASSRPADVEVPPGDQREQLLVLSRLCGLRQGPIAAAGDRIRANVIYRDDLIRKLVRVTEVPVTTRIKEVRPVTPGDLGFLADDGRFEGRRRDPDVVVRIRQNQSPGCSSRVVIGHVGRVAVLIDQSADDVDGFPRRGRALQPDSREQE